MHPNPPTPHHTAVQTPPADHLDLAAVIADGGAVIRCTTDELGRRRTTIDGPAGRWTITRDQLVASAYRVRNDTDPSLYAITRDSSRTLRIACDRAGIHA